MRVSNEKGEMEFLKQRLGYDGRIAWLAFRRVRERRFVTGAIDTVDTVDNCLCAYASFLQIP